MSRQTMVRRGGRGCALLFCFARGVKCRALHVRAVVDRGDQRLMQGNAPSDRRRAAGRFLVHIDASYGHRQQGAGRYQRAQQAASEGLLTRSGPLIGALIAQ